MDGSQTQAKESRAIAASLSAASVRFGDFTALSDITLDIEAGDFYTILGPSGCGKSTMLRLVSDLVPPASGTVEIFGKSTEAARLAREFAFVFQDATLLPWRSALENVELPLEIGRKRGIKTPKGDRTPSELLELVGLKRRENALPHELSGGMQQRVALARCLANEPDVILMDEPLGALDALTREKMQSLVLDLWKETGKTIILITHSVEEALLLGERLLVMAPRPGRIHKEYRLPFAEMGVGADLRAVKKHPDYAKTREEILAMIWEMEEEIMGRTEESA